MIDEKEPTPQPLPRGEKEGKNEKRITNNK